jgi:elongation factor Ts
MEITPQLIKELREQTGVGVLTCKEALTASDGDINKATKWLRQKGINTELSTVKNTTEGSITSYIHTGSRVGVLLELNCETNSVATSDEFRSLAHSIGMQIAACSSVDYVSVSDIPQSLVEKETSIEMGRDDLGKKPQNIKEKIVQGRIDKRLKELSLMDQPYIKDSSITVGELISNTSEVCGETLVVRRFIRFTLGENN